MTQGEYWQRVRDFVRNEPQSAQEIGALAGINRRNACLGLIWASEQGLVRLSLVDSTKPLRERKYLFSKLAK